MDIDLDRLHDIALGIRKGRGYGKTVLMCHAVLGAIQLGDEDILICLPYRHNLCWFAQMLIDILETYGYLVSFRNEMVWEVLAENVMIRFAFGMESLVMFGIPHDVAVIGPTGDDMGPVGGRDYDEMLL